MEWLKEETLKRLSIFSLLSWWNSLHSLSKLGAVVIVFRLEFSEKVLILQMDLIELLDQAHYIDSLKNTKPLTYINHYKRINCCSSYIPNVYNCIPKSCLQFKLRYGDHVPSMADIQCRESRAAQ